MTPPNVDGHDPTKHTAAPLYLYAPNSTLKAFRSISAVYDRHYNSDWGFLVAQECLTPLSCVVGMDTPHLQQHRRKHCEGRLAGKQAGVPRLKQRCGSIKVGAAW